jgi:protein gp37
MASSSSIEWTDATWNPVTGCTKVSPGCDHCYALTFAERFRGVPGHYFERGFDVQLRPNMLRVPSSWRKPRLVFVNSMSDLFHRDVPDSYIAAVFLEIEKTTRHIYQILTKRPDRMRRFIKARYGKSRIPGHVWLGVSVEHNDYAWRAELLRDIDATLRFLSVEPMLGSIDRVSLEGISWVIVGGESGPRYREIKESWVRDVRDRCRAARIPFFFKQWHKAKTGRILDGRTWDEMPPTRSAVRAVES